MTVKCQGCGAEIGIDTNESLEARCHWCRQPLSINTRIPNGAIPDGILPFRITKETAMMRVREFVKGRWLFAHKQFKKEFTPENVFCVYLPYSVVDARFLGYLEGMGEKQTRKYTRDKKTYYDYDEYFLKRDLSVLVNDLSVASSSKRKIDTARNTNNVLQAVQPYPIEEAVDFRAHYLSGYNSERRDVDFDEIELLVKDQLLTTLRGLGSRTIRKYDPRGVRWESEKVTVEGARFASIYLPIWLYSFVEHNSKEVKGQKNADLIHYIAVNGITGKTMGSVPINRPLLLFVSWVIGLTISIPLGFFDLFINGFIPSSWLR